MIFRISAWSSTGAPGHATFIFRCATRIGSNGRNPGKPWLPTISRGTAPKPSITTGASKMGTLTGKTAVVTGSTSGIGLAYARAFAGAGANIVLNGMGAPADIEKERSGIETDFKVKAVHSPADMTKPAEKEKGPPRDRAGFQGKGVYFPRRHDQARRDRRYDRAR